METRGKGSKGKETLADDKEKRQVIDSNLGILKRSGTKSRMSPHTASKENYAKQEKFLADLLCRDLDIIPGTLLKVTIELGLLTYPEEKAITLEKANKSFCQIKKSDILVFLGIRYDPRSATYNARVLLPDTQIVWVPFSCFKDFMADNSIETIRDFTSFFVCLLVKHDISE